MMSKTTSTTTATKNFDYANPETVKCDDIYLTEKSIGPLIHNGEAYSAVQSVLMDTPRNISIHLTPNAPNTSEYESHGLYGCVQPTAACNESADSILTPLTEQGISVQNPNEREDQKDICSLNGIRTDCEHFLEKKKTLLHLQHCTSFFQCSTCEPRSNTQNLYLEESSSKIPCEMKNKTCEQLGGYDCNDTSASKKKGPSRKNTKKKKEMSISYDNIADESTVLHHLMSDVTCRLSEGDFSKTMDSNMEEDIQNDKGVMSAVFTKNCANEEKQSYTKYYETSPIKGGVINGATEKSRETKQDSYIPGTAVQDVSTIMTGEKNRRRKTTEPVANCGNIIRKVLAEDSYFFGEKCHPMMTRHRKMSKGNYMNNNSSNDIHYNEPNGQLVNNYDNNNNNNNNNNINNKNNNNNINNNIMTKKDEFLSQTQEYRKVDDLKENIDLNDYVNLNMESIKYLPKSALNDSMIDIQTETNSNNDITETTTTATNHNKDVLINNVSKSRNKIKGTYMLNTDLQLEHNISNTMCEGMCPKQTFSTIQEGICSNITAEEKIGQHELVLDEMELMKRNFTPNKSIYYNDENCTRYTEEKTDDTSKQSDSTFNTWKPVNNVSDETNRIIYHVRKKKSTKGKGGKGRNGEDTNDIIEENQETSYVKTFYEDYNNNNNNNNNVCHGNDNDSVSKSTPLRLRKSSGLKKKEESTINNDGNAISILKKKKLNGKCLHITTKKKMEKSSIPLEPTHEKSDRYPNMLHEHHYYSNTSDNYDVDEISEEEKQILHLMKSNNNFYKKMSTRDVIYNERPESSTGNENNNQALNSTVDDKKIHSKRNDSLGLGVNIDVCENGKGKERAETYETQESSDQMSTTKSVVSVNKETENANTEQLTNNENTKRNAVQTKRDSVAGVKRNDTFIEQRSTASLTPKQKIKRMWHKLKRHTTHKEFNVSPDPDHAKEKNLASKKSDATHDSVDKNNDIQSENYKNKITCIDNISSEVTAAESDIFAFNKMETTYKCEVDEEEKEVDNMKQTQNIKFIENEPKQPCLFNWKLARKVLAQMFQNANDYSYEGVKFHDWKLNSIPTLGFSKSSNRVQLMFKASVPIRPAHDVSAGKGGMRSFSTEDMNAKKEVKFFVKKIPVYIWVEQFNLMDKYDGEYVTDGENFVMEAAALAFLNQYHPGITPKLYKILYEPEGHELVNEKLQSPVIYENLSVLNDMLARRLKANINGHIIIISEFFNEDILDYIDRKQRKHNMKISNQEKLFILHHCLNLLIKLHNAGLSHLDLTPENILISENYELRLCDLAKSTPLYSHNLRHLKVNGNTNTLYPFESCEPTIAKGSYMPPECWKIYWRYDTMKIRNPLKELKRVVEQERRKLFYFNVANADKFMLGVFFFWIWTNGNIWKYSDPLQDEDFFYFVKCKMDFDKFELTKRWPTHLKHIVRELLHPESRAKLNLNDLSEHPLWSHKF